MFCLPHRSWVEQKKDGNSNGEYYYYRSHSLTGKLSSCPQKNETDFTVRFLIASFSAYWIFCYHVYVWTDGTSYIFYIAKDLANLSNNFTVIQYINIMQILRHSFPNLNQQLAICCDSKSRISDHSLIKFRSEISRLHIRITQTASTTNNLTETPTTHNYILPDTSVPMSNTGPDEVSLIHTLRRIYSGLYDITVTINWIYGYQIILDLAYDFVSLVSFL